MAFLASSLVAEVAGTLTLLIFSTPVSLAVFTASLVVALLILAIAPSASFCAWPTNVDFSSAVKLVPLIAVFLSANAVLIALMAASLVAEVAGTLTLLIFSTPFSLAVFTASLVLAALMLALALFASALASVVNLAFSSSVKLDLLISSIFLAKASSIALLASSLVAEVSGTLTLLIVSTPFSLAVFTASLVVALLMLAIASSASFCAWLTNVDFSSAVKLVPLIAVFLSANAVLIALMASVLETEAGISTALIAFSPLVCAVLTSASFLAASILSFAV